MWVIVCNASMETRAPGSLVVFVCADRALCAYETVSQVWMGLNRRANTCLSMQSVLF